MYDAEKTKEQPSVGSATRRHRTILTRQSRRDLLFVAVLSVSAFWVAIMFNLADRVVSWFHVFKQWEVDEIPLFLFVLSVSSSWFAFRRWGEMGAEVVQRKHAESTLKTAHDELEIRVEERTAALLRANEQLQEEITERKRAKEALQTFAAKLERSNRELQDFAYVASHDLQEPLRKIRSFGDRLKAKCGAALSEQGHDYLERMQNAARRMQSLINDLLTFARVTTKTQPFVPVDLAQVAREVVTDLEMRIEQTEGRVEVGDLPTIEADPLQMRQLFQNLISNALKYRREDEAPLITIQSQHRQSQQRCPPENTPGNGLCHITVADNGIGFDTKYLDRIFTMFQRLHGRGTYEGTGVGLAVCHKIIERHGGSITAKSAPAEGATFIVTLPVTHPKGDNALCINTENLSPS